MPYSAEISRRNPTAIIFLLDQSGSMGEWFSGTIGIRKADGAAKAINAMIDEIIDRCTKDGNVRDYFEIGVIGYGAGEGYVGSILKGIQDFAKVSWLAEHPLKVIEERPGVKTAIWIEPVSDDGTPMCRALSLAYEWLNKWIPNHPNAYPPMVFNITDGQATDGDPEPLARKIMELSTNDGHVLMYNCHISEVKAEPILYPSSEGELPPDEFALKLFRMSSELPEYALSLAMREYKLAKKGSKGFAFNADLTSLIRFIDIGTRPAREMIK
jgi:uncharacterized protein YegL